MDKTAFQQLVKRPPVEPFCAAGCRTLEIYRQVLKGGLRRQRADTPAGHTDGEYILMHDGKQLNKDAFNRWLKNIALKLESLHVQATKYVLRLLLCYIVRVCHYQTCNNF